MQSKSTGENLDKISPLQISALSPGFKELTGAHAATRRALWFRASPITNWIPLKDTPVANATQFFLKKLQMNRPDIN
jgi:hypothetical protein